MNKIVILCIFTVLLGLTTPIYAASSNSTNSIQKDVQNIDQQVSQDLNDVENSTNSIQKYIQTIDQQVSQDLNVTGYSQDKAAPQADLSEQASENSLQNKQNLTNQYNTLQSDVNGTNSETTYQQINQYSSNLYSQDKAAYQVELSKDAFERALQNMRELSEIIANSNLESSELLNERFAELKELIQKLHSN